MGWSFLQTNKLSLEGTALVVPSFLCLELQRVFACWCNIFGEAWV
jgi:hypothetical protein